MVDLPLISNKQSFKLKVIDKSLIAIMLFVFFTGAYLLYVFGNSGKNEAVKVIGLMASLFIVMIFIALIAKKIKHIKHNGSVNIFFEKIIIKSGTTNQTLLLKDISSIKIYSNYYDGYEVKLKDDVRIHDGLIKFIFTDNKNKKFQLNSKVISYKHYNNLQGILKRWYLEKKLALEEYNYSFPKNDRPLLLHHHSFSELQELKKELGITGHYF